jgi:LysM repeat protein
MDLSIMFDGWVGNVSVEKDIQELNRMFLPNADLTPPRTIMIDGPTPVKGAKWVIEGIDWGTRTIWRSGKGWTKGERLRQDATVHLLQIVPETVLKKLSPTTGLTIHTVKSGETVRKIAAKHGVSVAAIKKANKIRDPKTVKTGQTIKVPPSTSGSTYSNVLPVPKGMAFSKETADNRPDTSGRVPPIHWNPR